MYQGAVLTEYLNYVREWAFQMFPSMAFEDVVSRTEVFSTKGLVKQKLIALRKEEKERYLHAQESQGTKKRKQREEDNIQRQQHMIERIDMPVLSNEMTISEGRVSIE